MSIALSMHGAETGRGCTWGRLAPTLYSSKEVWMAFRPLNTSLGCKDTPPSASINTGPPAWQVTAVSASEQVTKPISLTHMGAAYCMCHVSTQDLLLPITFNPKESCT